MNTTPTSTATISFAIECATRRRIAVFRGSVGDRDLYDAYEALLNDPTYDASLDDLIDLRGVTHMGVTGAGLHRLIALYDDRPSDGFRTRAAIIAPTDVLYGVSRMFQTLRGEDTPDQVEVFRTPDEALRWLDRCDLGSPAAT
ncbi:MAG: hypothetical protein U5K74_06805 [Gemmatimonadaceae bacterium]|nr:hypothetical protein [Gemmatimonadaceae bacterium]